MTTRRKAPHTRAEQKQDTREKLLTAARTVLARRGLEKTTTREIALTAGVASGTLFLHFPGVPALVEALLDSHLERTLARAYTSLPRRGSLIHRLVHVARHLYDSYGAEADLSRAWVANSLFHADPQGPAVPRLKAFEEWVSSEIAAAEARKEIAPMPGRLGFLMFFSLYFSLLVAGLRKELTREQQLAMLTQALERSFRKEKKS